jgi:hypothetical protein
MIDQSKTQFGAQVSAEFPEVGAIKLLAIVHYDSVWHSEAADDVLPKKLLYGRRSNAQQQFCLYPLGELFHCHYCMSVVAWRGW